MAPESVPEVGGVSESRQTAYIVTTPLRYQNTSSGLGNVNIWVLQSTGTVPEGGWTGSRMPIWEESEHKILMWIINDCKIDHKKEKHSVQRPLSESRHAIYRVFIKK